MLFGTPEPPNAGYWPNAGIVGGYFSVDMTKIYSYY